MSLIKEFVALSAIAPPVGNPKVVPSVKVAAIEWYDRVYGYSNGSKPTAKATSTVVGTMSENYAARHNAGVRAQHGERASMELLIVAAFIVIATTAWVGYDASAHQVAVDGNDYSFNNGAVAWVLSCCFLWLFMFPYYLAKRSKSLSLQQSHPPTSHLCPHCGKYYQGTLFFCPHCKAKISP